MIKRDKETRSGAGSKKPLSTCKYFTELCFLRDRMANRNCETNVPSSITNPIASPLNSTAFDEIFEDPSMYSPNENSNTSSSPQSVCGNSRFSSAPASKVRKRKDTDFRLEENADILLAKVLDKHLDQSASEKTSEKPTRR